jgi:hypothetical protein
MEDHMEAVGEEEWRRFVDDAPAPSDALADPASDDASDASDASDHPSTAR